MTPRPSSKGTTSSKKSAAKGPTRVAFFFGAGAERSYGMPTGGRFALEILKAERPKEQFRKIRERINGSCDITYRKWLPPKFATDQVHGLGKTELRSVFEDSLRTGFARVIASLDSYDTAAAAYLKRIGKDEADAAAIFGQSGKGTQWGATPYANVRSDRLAGGKPLPLFRSKYFNAVMALANTGDASMIEIARSTIQFYLGACGRGNVQAIADSPLDNIPDDNPAFHELGPMLDVNPVEAGLAAFEKVMENRAAGEAEEIAVFRDMALSTLESTVEEFLDYREMMDELLPSLFSPSDNWRRFTKVFQFLLATRHYVLQREAESLDRTDGYYHDLRAAIENASIHPTTIGTANYTSLCKSALQGAYTGKIQHLNGSLNEYLDPYRNEIISADLVESVPRFLAPFIFTQSGVKPLTSVDVSKRYVDYYNDVVKSKYAVVVGFGFNGDDGHINTLFRQAVDRENLRLVVLWYSPMPGESPDLHAVADKVRIEKLSSLKVLSVDGSRRVNGEIWTDALVKAITAW